MARPPANFHATVILPTHAVPAFPAWVVLPACPPSDKLLASTSAQGWEPMPNPFPSTRPLATTFRVADLVVVAICATVVAAWAALAAGSVSLTAWLACEAAFVAFYLAGSLAAAWRPFAAGILFDLPMRLLVGYSVVNTALFVLAWISPLGIVANFGLVSGLVAAAFLATRPVRARDGAAMPGLCAVLVALVAATLWCQDSLLPIEVRGDITIIKPWIDSFYHTVHIRMFSAAHGASSIQDFRMAGVPARLYHYAAYLTPALIKQASGLPSYTAFAGILVPMGVFFAGLGAYALVASFWGTWPGLAACAALLLLPDGAQQGMGNTFLSYHWLAQISPGATFGLSMIALAWLFVLRGSTRGSLFQVGVGWMYGGVGVVYKAQFFVAIALVLLALPPLFLRRRRRLRRGLRIAWLAVAMAAFVVVIVISQKLSVVPLIRLDGSSTGRFLDLVISYAGREAAGVFPGGQIGSGKPWLPNLVLGAPYLLLATLGIIGPVLVALMFHLRKRVAGLFRIFPLVIAANFLVMALGLALDTRHVGTPEELQHRPFLLMYFVLAAWTGAAGGFALLRSRWVGHLAKPIIACLILLLLAVPALEGPNLQGLRTMPHEAKIRIPTGLLRATEFMRDHGSAADVFQASSLDPMYIIAALSDRQPYYDRQLYWVRESELALLTERTSQVVQLMQLEDPGMVIMTAYRMGLQWFLLYPEQSVAWSPIVAAHPAFQSGGFKLYRFD